MKPIKVNLATSVYIDKRLVYSVLAALSIMIILISLGNIYLKIRYDRKIIEYEQKIVRLDRNLSKRQNIVDSYPKKITKEEMLQIQNKADFINSLIALDVFPFSSLFDTIEKSIPEDLILKSFARSDDYNKLIFKGSSGSAGAIAGFLKTLDEATIFQKNALMNLSVSANKKTGRKQIDFEIESKIDFYRIFPEDSNKTLSRVLNGKGH